MKLEIDSEITNIKKNIESIRRYLWLRYPS